MRLPHRNDFVIVLFILSMLIFIFSFQPASAADADAENQNLINVNPDPSGEPWIAGGINKAEWDAAIAAMPLLEAAPQSGLGKQMMLPPPDKIDNTTFPSFRPIFNQKGGSCAQASSIAYVYTYEINYLRELAANTADNQYPYDFTYNFTNSGSGSNGSMPEQGFGIVKALGVPNATLYGGFGLGKFNQWVSGYPIYLNAMTNRLSEFFRINVSTATGVAQMKQWLTDHQNGSSQGGCLVQAYNASGEKLVSIPANLPGAGQKIMYAFGNGGGHAVTIAGFNDSIRYDYNADGKYSNTTDFNNDGKVDVKDWEIGAYLMVNSWGTSFGNSGKVWIPYRMLAVTGGVWSSTLYGMKTQAVKTFKPLLTYKVVLSHSQRNLVRIRAGFANSATATAPTGTPKNFSNAFNYCGGVYPMQGINTNPIEIGLDVTDFMPNLTSGETSLFLLVDSKGGTGSIASFSLLDYTGGDTPVELICSQKNVNIPTGTTTLKITKTLKSLMVLTPNGGEKLERGRTFPITWYDRLTDNVKIELLKNNAVVSTIASSAPSSGTYDWAIPEDVAIGADYTIKISSVSDANVSDVSDKVFSIQAKTTLVVTSPNGNEYLEKGKPVQITWNSTLAGNVKIELYKDRMQDTIIAASVQSTGSYTWNVPTGIPSGITYTVRITGVDNAIISDESDSCFRIVNPIVRAPYVQNFDALTSNTVTIPGSWEQMLDDDLDWTVFTGPTPSKVSATGGGTGPNGDHTSGTGKYIYVEASGANTPAKEAIALSPMFNTTGLAGLQIAFWYHMYSKGNNMGNFYIDVYADGVWYDSVAHLSGDNGDQWHEQVITLAEALPDVTGQLTKVQVRFRGITGISYDSDICIDDFKLTGGATSNIFRNTAARTLPLLACVGNRIVYRTDNATLSIFLLSGARIVNATVHGIGSMDISQLAKGIYIAKINATAIRFVR
jgi:hypothetical protein